MSELSILIKMEWRGSVKTFFQQEKKSMYVLNRTCKAFCSCFIIFFPEHRTLNEAPRNLCTFSLLRPSLIALSFEAKQRMKTLIDFLPY